MKRLVNTALGGEPIGALYEGERRFDIVAKFDRSVVTSAEAIRRLPVHTANGIPVPLAEVARIEIIDGQTIIARENGVRRMTVRATSAAATRAASWPPHEPALPRRSARPMTPVTS